MALVLTAQQAANLLFRGSGNHLMTPKMLSDGRYAVAEECLTNRYLSQYQPILKAGSVEATTGLTAYTSDALFQLINQSNSQPMRLQSAVRPYAFGMPAANIHRFELRSNDFGWEGDQARNSRRCELVSQGPAYSSGETVWAAFSFVVGPQHVPFDDGSGAHNMIHQWHSVDEGGRIPIITVQLVTGNLVVATASDAEFNVQKIRYNSARPIDGTPHNVVISATLGQAGHINVWLDGSEIVNTDAPIGYYNDTGGLGYPHWGLYQENSKSPSIVFHANIEWGLTDLSARIATPLTVNAPPGGWV